MERFEKETRRTTTEVTKRRYRARNSGRRVRPVVLSQTLLQKYFVIVSRAAWKIIPERFDFYYSLNGGIADRVVFTKDGTEKWKYVHVGA